jgi:hypothetical protein
MNMVPSTRQSSKPLLLSTTPLLNNKRVIVLPMQRQGISFWNIPLGLMTASPLKRRLALVALGGTSLAVAIVLGPFLLVGLGGIAAAVAFRFWRFKKQLLQQNQTLGDWPDFLNAFIQQQQVFGKDQLQVQKEAIKKLDVWSQSSQGRERLIEYGIHPERVTQHVSMRGSSYSSRMVNNDKLTEIKIELDLKNTPDTVLIAIAEIDKEGSMSFKDLRLVTHTGILKIPLTVNQNNGRIIEGEFRDI